MNSVSGPRRAVILAGGKGTRLAPYTKILPKPLVPIGDMPILEVLLRQLKRSGVEHVTLTVGHLANLLEAFFHDGAQLGLTIDYSLEDRPLGTVGPLTLIPRPAESFLVCNGDVLTTLDPRALFAHHRASGATLTIAMHRRSVRIDLGVIEVGGQGVVTGYLEKPTRDYMVSMGLYVFEPRALDYLQPGEYFDFPDLVHLLLARGEKVCGYAFDGYWQDLGRMDDYEQAAQDFERLRGEFLGDGD
jgi:NDP-sugar pyrophosphorylase family protein